MNRKDDALVIQGATLIDGVADAPLLGKSMIIEGGRIKAIAAPGEIGGIPAARVIDARGKYAIPGLMNANVHLLLPLSLERLGRHFGQYEDLIAEAAQVALKNGLTTVFDTWGPRRHLMNVRNAINEGRMPGSRIFCAGNIIGFEGPFSVDFIPRLGEAASAGFTRRINSTWVENVGRHLMWLTPEQVADEVRTYIGKGIDFVKYASNEHGAQAAGAFIQFSQRVQEAIVSATHGAGLTAQAHCMTVEGLRLALEAGCDLITHCNITGPTPIPPSTIELFARKRAGAVVFPFTQRRIDWFLSSQPTAIVGAEIVHTMYRAADANVRNLIQSDAMLMLANDAGIWPPEYLVDPTWEQLMGPQVDNYLDLAEGHFYWFKAMEEKGCRPMEMLRAATRNIALAYKKDKDLGTLEPGKVADVLILDRNPLASAEHYRSIHTIIKGGEIIDRAALAVKPILTLPIDPPAEEEEAYRPFVRTGGLPTCPMCLCSWAYR